MSDRTREYPRRRLIEAIVLMAAALDAGEVTPTREELRVLAIICDEYQLPDCAARVRRWSSRPAVDRGRTA